METNYIEDYKEAVQLAIQRETEAERFYEKIAEKIHEPETKSLLKRLAIEEKKHQKLLSTFSNEIKEIPQGAFVPPENFTYAVADLDLKTPEEIFKLALQREEESLNFYSRFLVYFFGTGHEKFFKEIFNMELNHKEQLERNMKNYLKQ